MQKIGSRAYFSCQLINQLFCVLNIFGNLCRVLLRTLRKLAELHPQCGQGLTSTVVELTRHVSALPVLNL